MKRIYLNQKDYLKKEAHANEKSRYPLLINEKLANAGRANFCTRTTTYVLRLRDVNRLQVGGRV